MKSKILITGAAGFLGRNLGNCLLAHHSEVSGIDLAPQCPVFANYTQADLREPGEWAEVFRGVETVYHLAGKVHALTEVAADETEYFKANTQATQHVLEAAKKHGVKRFVFFSTVKAMTRDEEATAFDTQGQWRPWNEGDARQPDTPYGQSKLAAERLVLSGGFVPEPIVLRLCMVYGLGAKGNIMKMIEAVLGNRFPPPPKIPNKRSMVHVEDVVQAALLCGFIPEAAGQLFIVSDGLSYSTRNIYELIMTAAGRTAPGWETPLSLLKVFAKTGDLIGKLRRKRFMFDSDALEKLTGNAWFSSEKIQSILGFRAKRNLPNAIPEMVASLRKANAS